MKIYKWSGAGNIFAVMDGRGSDASAFRREGTVREICSRFGTDGFMILNQSLAGRDFAMEFYNPDGSGGMMCGNGGRCIAAFAKYLNLPQKEEGLYVFDAPDGEHSAKLLSRDSENAWTVRLRMKDVQGVREMLGGLFLNTGTRHFVLRVPDVEKVDVASEGAALRGRSEFAPEGSNVNFLDASDGIIRVRTFEKGVEAETMACGTGITASAIAAYKWGLPPFGTDSDGRVHYALKARRDNLLVDFIPKKEDAFESVFLTGPAELLSREEFV